MSKTANILDFEFHYGDGTANILGHRSWGTVCNPTSRTRDNYLEVVETFLAAHPEDIICVSSGFDHHRDNWGRLLQTQNYLAMRRMVIN